MNSGVKPKLQVAQCATRFPPIGSFESVLHQVEHRADVQVMDGGNAPREKNNDLFPRSHPENLMQSIVAKDLDEKKIVAIISVERLAFSGLGSEVMYIPLFFVLLVLPYLHPPWEKDVGLHFLSPEKILLPLFEAFYVKYDTQRTMRRRRSENTLQRSVVGCSVRLHQ
jgi:hypothetical protein